MADKNIEDIANDDTFNKRFEELKSTPDRRVCIFFMGTWSGPSKAIAPKFIALSKQHSAIQFWRVDLDKCKASATNQNVLAIPTFLFYVGGYLVRKFTGAAQQKLDDGVTALAEKKKRGINCDSCPKYYG